MKLDANLPVCSTLSVLIHGLVLLPGLAAWLTPLQPPSVPHALRPDVQVRLVPPRSAGHAQGDVLAASQPVHTSKRPAVAAPEPASAVAGAPERNLPTRASHHRVAGPAPAQARPIPTGYPVRNPSRRPQTRQSGGPPVTLGEGGFAILDPPVLLKGPQRIPIPPFLRNRDGHFLLTLRCQVAPDGSSRVTVMEGTGAPDLDESVRASFSGLPWYRAELNGKPVAVTVRLVIEGRWEIGEESVDWGGRIPHQETLNRG